MRLLKILSMVFYYIIGHLFAFILYDVKYRKSIIFKGRFCGLNAVGWKFSTIDGCTRLFLHKNHGIPFPVSPNIVLGNYKRIHFDIDDLCNMQSDGSYFQAWEADIVIGKGTYIARNVGIITNNHDFNDLTKRAVGKDVIIGERCWIGMNSVILPGTILGEHTIVGAGSVVTKSFLEGDLIIAGNPAKVIRKI